MKKKTIKTYLKAKITREYQDEMLVMYENDYIQSKKEVYIFTYILIAIVGFISICFVWEEMNSDYHFVRNAASALAVYIAFDRIIDKWKKAHDQPKASCNNCAGYNLERSTTYAANRYGGTPNRGYLVRKRRAYRSR